VFFSDFGLQSIDAQAYTEALGISPLIGGAFQLGRTKGRG
jgi:hypothetical protein